MESGIKRLSDAARDGNFSTVQELLKNRVDINAVNKLSEAPLILASTKGYVKICQLLLEHGANVNVINKSGNTPLRLASVRKNVETCRVIARTLSKYSLLLGFENNTIRHHSTSITVYAE